MGQVIEQSSILTQTPRVDSSKDKHLPSMTVLSWGRVHIYPIIGIRGMRGDEHPFNGWVSGEKPTGNHGISHEKCVFPCLSLHIDP